jgi:nickel/cobalt transporter (NicO) family protein
MRLAGRLAAFLAAAAAVTLIPATASAHPLGNFTVNRYAGIVLSAGEVRIDYVVDMAEIPTVQVLPQVDVDGDGVVSSSESADWAARTASGLLDGLSLSIDGAPVGLGVRSASMRLMPGQGGLDVLRILARFGGEASSSGRIIFSDANFEDRVGWREITIAGAPGVAIVDPSVPSESITNGLRAYPNDLLSSPLDVREATASFEQGESVPRETSTAPTATASGAGSGDAFVALVGRTGPFMILALVLAFAFGAFHALGPGHGKTLMAAYLVGSGGRTRHAVAVGGAVAVMHTASVLALGFVVLAATEVFPTEHVYPWLGIGSGLVAFGLGAWMLVTRLAAWSEGARHAHPHDHRHPHPHEHARPQGPALSRRGLAALAAAGGILPSPTALVVLLASVAAHRVGYGLALIAAFSLGLAAALVAVGVLSIRARDVITGRVAGRFARVIPVASAAAITVVGIVVVGGAAAQL